MPKSTKLPSVFICPCGYEIRGDNRKIVMCRRLHLKKCSEIEIYSKEELALKHKKLQKVRAKRYNCKVISEPGYYNTPDITFERITKP